MKINDVIHPINLNIKVNKPQQANVRDHHDQSANPFHMLDY